VAERGATEPVPQPPARVLEPLAEAQEAQEAPLAWPPPEEPLEVPEEPREAREAREAAVGPVAAVSRLAGPLEGPLEGLPGPRLAAGQRPRELQELQEPQGQPLWPCRRKTGILRWRP
jgi:hypothetical protein